MKAIIFDCFGVLYLNSSQHFYETNLDNYDELQTGLLALNSQADYGYITRQEHWQAVSELTGIPYETLERDLDGIHKLNQELVDYMAQLRGGYKIGMLSNISIESMQDFFPLPMREQLFDASLLSGEVGLTKPHPKIFELIAEKLGVPTGDCVMIDDLEDNCAGADAAGMKAIQYKSNQQVKRDLEKLLASS